MNKYDSNTNLFLLIKILIIYLCFGLNTYAGETNIKQNFVTMGADSAPVKVKIFSSLTCPHCANFHLKVLPEIKENYVKSGKVQLIFIDFPLDQAAFNASKLLNCLDSEKQIEFLDKAYENQNRWTSGSNLNEINNNLKKMVDNLGISKIDFNQCLNDEAISDKILNARIDGHEKYTIDSTPTIIINEKKLKGSASFENIKKKIEKLI